MTTTGLGRTVTGVGAVVLTGGLLTLLLLATVALLGLLLVTVVLSRLSNVAAKHGWRRATTKARRMAKRALQRIVGCGAAATSKTMGARWTLQTGHGNVCAQHGIVETTVEQPCVGSNSAERNSEGRETRRGGGDRLERERW